MFPWPLIHYILTAARRDRLIIVSVLVVLIGASIAIFLGSSAVIEADRFALVFAAGGLRLAGMAGLVLFIVFHIRRSFETRDVEFLLSRPISRTGFILAHAVGFSLVGTLIAGLVIITIYVPSWRHPLAGLPLWSISLVMEFIIMANAALFFSMVLSSPTGAAMATFGFYVLARMMGELLGISRTGDYLPGYHALAIVMQIISLITPRLDLFGQSSWLLYGVGNLSISYGFILLQGFVFSALLVIASLIDLVRRQF